MTLCLEATIQRFNWDEGDTKPVNTPEGSRGLDVSSGERWIFHDGNWVEDLSIIYAMVTALAE